MVLAGGAEASITPLGVGDLPHESPDHTNRH